MQAQFQQAYADSSADELLGVLHDLDADRLHAALHQAMSVQSGGSDGRNLIRLGSQFKHVVLTQT